MRCGRENSEVRGVAAKTLGKIGKHAAPAVLEALLEALTECLKDEIEHVRRVASEAVARSRGEAEAMVAEPRSLAAKGALQREI